MTALEALIEFWKTFLEASAPHVGSRLITKVKETILALEELRKLKGE